MSCPVQGAALSPGLLIMYLLATSAYFSRFGDDCKHHVYPHLRDQPVQSTFMAENLAAWRACIAQVRVVEKPLVPAAERLTGRVR